MNCTQCGKPAAPVTLAGTYLARCQPCAFCWFADDTVAFIHETLRGLPNAASIPALVDTAMVALVAYEVAVDKLKLRAKGANTELLIALVADLDKAHDEILKHARAAHADVVGILADQVPSDAAAMLTATLAKRKGAA